MGHLRRCAGILVGLILPVLLVAESPGLPEAHEDTIGYHSVSDAMTGLRMRADVETTEQDGWTIVADPTTHTFWSFAPKSHPAYPAVAKRQLREIGDQLFISLDVLCEAKKKPCDDFVRQFQALNAQMKERMKAPK